MTLHTVRCLTCKVNLWRGHLPMSGDAERYAVREMVKEHSGKGHDVRALNGAVPP